MMSIIVYKNGSKVQNLDENLKCTRSNEGYLQQWYFPLWYCLYFVQFLSN